MSTTARDELNGFVAAKTAQIATIESTLSTLTGFALLEKQQEIANLQVQISAAQACLDKLDEWQAAGYTTAYLQWTNGIPGVSRSLNIG